LHWSPGPIVTISAKKCTEILNEGIVTALEKYFNPFPSIAYYHIDV